MIVHKYEEKYNFNKSGHLYDSLTVLLTYGNIVV